MRLIDADALIISLRQKSVIPFSKMLLKDEHRWFIEFENIIKLQPTAYDVDKVVEQLEEGREFYKKKYEKYLEDVDLGSLESYIDAIEIVRKGGVSND